jgi:glycosyltransferase involved in cell wall biosynthesis
MKILHVLTSPRAEGTPRLVLDWLKTGMHDQFVLFLKSEPGDLIADFQNITNKLTFKNIDYSKKLSRTIKIIGEVQKTVRQEQPDIVISWNQGYANLIVLGSRLGGCTNNIVHVGCAPERGKYGYWYDYFVFLPIAALGGKAVCASQYIMSIFDKLLFFPKYIFKVIPNCVNYNKFFKRSKTYNNDKKAVLVANLELAKDHKILIDAWRYVVDIIPDASLTLVGRGSLYGIIQKQIENLDLTDNVFLLGPRSDVNEILWQHSLFVFSSNKNEGFGTVLIEALAACLQIVSFAEPAPTEVLKNGQYGILVHERTAIALANAIVLAFNTTPSVLQIEQQCLYAETFKVENMILNYIDFASQK